MENYKDLYFQLFNKITDTIENLKDIQCQMEELYLNISDDDNKQE